LIVVGDRRGLEALFASDEGRVLPQPSRTAILEMASQPLVARKAALPRLQEQMQSGMEKAIEGTNLIVTAKIRAELEKARDQAADQAVAKLSAAFAQGIGPIWWFNVVLLALLVAATVFIPSLPLGTKDPRAAPQE